MKKLLIILLLTGCSNAQRVADQAHQLAWQQTDNIVYDLSMVARQLTIDKYAAQARAAASSNDADGAALAVTGAIAEYDKITWLAREEYQKTRWGVGNLARQYILQQRWWGEVLYDQWQEAKNVASAETKTDDK